MRGDGAVPRLLTPELFERPSKPVLPLPLPCDRLLFWFGLWLVLESDPELVVAFAPALEPVEREARFLKLEILRGRLVEPWER